MFSATVPTSTPHHQHVTCVLD